MQFKDVIGQEAIKQHLIESYQSGRTAHAQILLGPQGAGALPLALAYAQYLNCENQQANDSCGECNACRKNQKFIHPDLHFSYPTIGTGKLSTDYIKEWRVFMLESPYRKVDQWLQKMGAENQKGNINKNECVDIVRKFSYTRVEGQYKILVLWMPEYLEKEGNRLLKLIEEPEPNTVFILVAERAEKILNTILSRCQLLKIPQLSDEDLANGLQQVLQVPEAQARQLAYLSEGNFAKAQSLAANSETDSNWATLFANWLRACYVGREQMPYWVEQFVTGNHPIEGKKGDKSLRKDQILLLQYGLFFLRELTQLVLLGDQAQLRLAPKEQKTAQGLSKILNPSQIESIAQLLDDTIYFVERNGHPKILFMDASIQIHRIFRQQN